MEASQAADMMELINIGVKFDECDPCETFESLENFRVVGEEFFDFFALRVHDILFCVDEVLRAIGEKYKLWSDNCWTFASWIMSSVRELFAGKITSIRNVHINHIRRRFWRNFVHVTLKFRIRGGDNLKGIQDNSSILYVFSFVLYGILALLTGLEVNTEPIPSCITMGLWVVHVSRPGQCSEEYHARVPHAVARSQRF